MNVLSLSGQKVDENLQIEIELKTEVKNYKLQFLFLSVQHNQTFPSLKPENSRLILNVLVVRLSKFM